MSFFHPDVIPTPVHDHKREVGFAVPDPSTIPTDQSIIVGTVGVMALLVGALSARRLRSRGFLGVCLDTDVQDELAYDAAYTVPQSNYSTFSWKGDLEKFDV